MNKQKIKLFTRMAWMGIVVSFQNILAADDKTTPQPNSKWRIQILAIDANEGIAAGDIDGDGLVDLVAGRNWYRAPEFAPRPVRAIEDWNGYVQSNGDFLYDINKDGRLDVVSGSFIPTEVLWFENPGDEGLRLGQVWKRHVLIETGRSENEGELLFDLDQDGFPEWIVNSWNKKNPVVVYRFVRREPTADNQSHFELIPATIADSGNAHGMGYGDLDGDGKIDLLTGAGWYQQPSSEPWSTTWNFHPDWSIEASIPMLVVDVDGDSRNDVVVGKGHDFGLFWWRQNSEKPTEKFTYQSILIDDGFSQPHTLAWQDLDADGQPELITGKRYFAHNGGDPGGRDMPELNCYRFDKKSMHFEKQTIEQGHIGCGLQLETLDLNNDGKIDIAVAGKSGTYILYQE